MDFLSITLPKNELNEDMNDEKCTSKISAGTRTDSLFKLARTQSVKELSIIKSVAKMNIKPEEQHTSLMRELKIKLPPLPQINQQIALQNTNHSQSAIPNSVISPNTISTNTITTNNTTNNNTTTTNTTNTISTHTSTCQTQIYSKTGDEEDFITLEIIEKWNSQIGNMENPNRVLRLINKMRKLGELEPSEIKTNIPNARLGLCLLAHYDKDQKVKMFALESLLRILKNDNYSVDNSYLLVQLAIDLLQLLARSTIQTADLSTQIKLSEIYRVLAETIDIHAG
ncbi:MAG TPA: hypothetical protein VGP47_02380, partial [Parachlamydiaceae bacterium]|nr:hypothetical protein [Parachlamydiaceae bacterium]